jgi:hypothetical protein
MLTWRPRKIEPTKKNWSSYDKSTSSNQRLKLRTFRFQSTYQLQRRKTTSRIQYCYWFLGYVREGFKLFDNLLFTDETWLLLSGYIYSAKSKIWSAENPHEMHEEPLHLWSLMLGAKCLEIELWYHPCVKRHLLTKAIRKFWLIHSPAARETDCWFLEDEGERPNYENKNGCLGKLLLCSHGRMWALATMIAAPHNTWPVVVGNS